MSSFENPSEYYRQIQQLQTVEDLTQDTEHAWQHLVVDPFFSYLFDSNLGPHRQDGADLPLVPLFYYDDQHRLYSQVAANLAAERSLRLLQERYKGQKVAEYSDEAASIEDWRFTGPVPARCLYLRVSRYGSEAIKGMGTVVYYDHSPPNLDAIVEEDKADAEARAIMAVKKVGLMRRFVDWLKHSDHNTPGIWE